MEFINFFVVLQWNLYFMVVRESLFSIVIRYGLDGSGIELRWGRDFPHPSRPGPGSTQPPVHWVSGIFPGGKAAVPWR